jgi:hypothetical protein
VTPREKLEYAYKLAFYPPELNRAWNRVKNEDVDDPEALGEALDIALTLHQALPEERVASQRALNRLALYQAKSRAFGMVRFLRNIRKRLGRPPLDVQVVPGHMVRDVGLPPLARS